ncbi:MAG TPA: S8 family serine peptidase [Gemmatimonadaceae bacterium]|nr:S8 family serine peptidase [Gemmatimonadaceae bacterium]
MKRFVPLAVAALAVAACQDASGPTPARPAAPSTANAAKGAPLPGDYIVRLRDDVVGVQSIAQSIAGLHKGQLKHIYQSALKGFAVRNLSDAAAAAIAADPRVLYVEQDQEFHAVTTTPNPQLNPPSWGLDRIDQRSWSTPSYSYAFTATGNGVTAYIIDTGIDFTHPDLEGRARSGVDEITIGGSATDCNGHGTHVSGTVGGATYGVAKDVSFVAVRVLDCSGSGSTSGVAAGIDWVTANAHKPAVANMSLGGGASSTLDAAVSNSINSGVTYAIAAGNGNFFGIAQDACTTSPARVATAITVSATDNTDTKASWANYGTCVDIFAPGVAITSSWWSSSGQTQNTISGTSMATPHVTGAAALYLETDPTAAPATVAAALINNATTAVVKNAGSGTPNRLLYTGSEAAPPPPPAPVTANFTKSCSRLTCSFTNTSTNTTASTTYSWDFGDGSPLETTANATHTFGERSSYTVKLTAVDGVQTSTASTGVTCNKRNCS